MRRARGGACGGQCGARGVAHPLEEGVRARVEGGWQRHEAHVGHAKGVRRRALLAARAALPVRLLSDVLVVCDAPKVVDAGVLLVLRPGGRLAGRVGGSGWRGRVG
eukprot:3117575-Prymnesium_polylepis.1